MKGLALWITLAALTGLASAQVDDFENFLDPDAFIIPIFPDLPEEVTIQGNDPEYNPETNRLTYKGPFSLKADNGMTLKGRNARLDLEKNLIKLSGGVTLTMQDGVTLKSNRAEYNTKAEKATLNGLVSLTQPSNGTSTAVQLFADDAVIDTQSQLANLDGNVAIYSGGTLQKGDNATYNFATRAFQSTNLRTGVDPFLLEAGAFRSETIDGRQAFVGENSGVTTHDVSDPNYWIRSNKTTVFPGDKVVFEGLKVYAGDTPVFYLPYLSQPLDAELGYFILPGARSNWGPYLLNRYGILLGGKRDPITGINEDAWLLAQFKLDILTRRGIGLGVNLRDRRRDDNPNLTGFSAYYLNDADPSLRRTNERRGNVDPNRWKLQYRDQITIGQVAGQDLDAFADLTLLSDRFYLEDFEPRTFRKDPEPDNIIGLTTHSDSTLFTLYARLRANDFYRTSPRLPELAVDQIRRPVFGTSILHEGQTRLGVYRDELADPVEDDLRDQAAALRITDPASSRLGLIDSQLNTGSFARFHTYQELSLPTNIGGWLSLVPRAGLGYTLYTDIDGDAGSANRTHLFAGLEGSVKFSKNYADVESQRLGLDGLLHIVQPYVNASWLRTDELDASFGRIDTLTTTTRPRLRTPGRFNAVDDLKDWTVFRLGVRNRLITSRDDRSHQWLTLDTYIDAFGNDPELDRKLSNLYNDLSFTPVPWLSLRLETQFPIIGDNSGFSEISGSATFRPTRSTEFSVGNRFLRNHPVLRDSNVVDIHVLHRINDLWALEANQRWEFETGILEVQQYNIQRDFQSWIVSAGLLLRDNDSADEFGFLLSFTLKEFPDVTLPLSVDTEQ